MPPTLRLDNHRTFHSKTFTAMFERLGIFTSFTAPTNSQANVLVERLNKHVQDRLKALTFSVAIGVEVIFQELKAIMALICWEHNSLRNRGRKHSPIEYLTAFEPLEFCAQAISENT